MHTEDAAAGGLNQARPAAWNGLPVELRRFVYGSACLAAVCAAVIALCRWVPSLGYAYYPYNTPVLYGPYRHYDYSMFFDRFRYFHSPEFFTAHAGFVFSYPAPMAVFYKLTYVATDNSTGGYLAMVGAAFVATAALFARALVKAKVAPVTAVLFAECCLLLSDPVWFELNRANLEFYVWIFLTLGVWLFFRGRSYGAAACFGVAGAMKLFPFIYLGLLIARKQYRQVAVSLAVATAVTVASLWMVCPDIGLAWRGLNDNASVFGRVYLLQRLWHEVGFDHSLFALVKVLWRHLPGPAVMNRVLTIYTVVAAVGGTVLYFTRIRHLPAINQLLCLASASVLLPPSSSDYTLIHLYAPWAAMVFVALDAARTGREVPGLAKVFVCFTILMAPENEVFFRSDRIEGQIKALALMALWALAMKHPFEVEASETQRRRLTAYEGGASLPA